MQRVKNLCIGLVNCIYQCFRTQKDQYKDRMIELEERLKKPNTTATRQQQPDIFSTPRSEVKQESEWGTPKKIISQPPIIQLQANKEQNIDQQIKRISNRSQDSFFSINSGVRSSQSISRRTFKKVKSMKSSKLSIKQGQFIKNNEFKQITNQNQSLQQPNLQLIRVDSQYGNLSEALFEWNQKQYNSSSTYSFQMTPNQKSKLSSSTFLDEAINKLEDYYTFYLQQIQNKFTTTFKKQQMQLNPYQGWFLRKSPQLKCSYHSQNENIQTDDQFMMSVISFKCNTTNTLQFLKWYNSQATQSKLFDFKKIKLIENGVYPVLQAQNYGIDLKQKNNYLLARQIQIVKFDSDPDSQYILQLDTTFRKGKSFKSLLRFQNSDNGLVQIYCQTTAIISSSTQNFYKKKWETIDKMIRQKSLKLSTSKVYH